MTANLSSPQAHNSDETASTSILPDPTTKKLPNHATKSREEALASYKEATRNISNLVKYIGFGLMAAFYALRPEISELSSDDPIRVLHMSVGLLGASVIVFDYLHYTFSARNAYIALLNKRHGFQYNRKLISYRLGRFFYFAKQISTFLGSMVIIILIILGDLVG